jgi:hypothetical protein
VRVREYAGNRVGANAGKGKQIKFKCLTLPNTSLKTQKYLCSIIKQCGNQRKGEEKVISSHIIDTQCLWNIYSVS